MNVYERFIIELDEMTIGTDEPVAAVVGRLIRAVKRAQMVNDGELKSPRERGWGEHSPEPIDQPFS